MTGPAPLPKGPRFFGQPADPALVELAGMADQAIRFLAQSVQQIGRPLEMPKATVAQLTANPATFRPTQGRWVYCVDLAGTQSGAPVFGDGLVWRTTSNYGTLS